MTSAKAVFVEVDVTNHHPFFVLARQRAACEHRTMPVTHAKHEERDYDRGPRTGHGRPNGRWSIAISGLTPAQLAVIEGALANVLVCGEDEHVGAGAGSGQAGGSAGG